MNESIKFYFEHAENINAAEKLVLATREFLDFQIGILCENLNLKEFSFDKYNYRNLIEENNPEVYYTLVLDSFFSSTPKITIILELKGATKNKANELFNNEVKIKCESRLLKEKLNSGEKFLHYLKKDYSLNENQLAELVDTIENFIASDFQDIFEEVKRSILTN